MVREHRASKPFTLSALDRTTAQKSYFFLEGSLYKKIRQDSGRDLLVAKDIKTGKLVHFLLTEAKKKMKNAYDLAEVAKLVNRSKRTVQYYVVKGLIKDPARIYKDHVNSTGHRWSTMKFSEEDILALHDYLMTVGGGRPRKDGFEYSGANIPSRRELLALLRQQPIFYMRTQNGDVVPVWSANNEV